MIDLNHCNEWQHRDSSNGLVFPWYTKSFLDELVTWELSDKVVFEYGAGASTLWWAKRAKKVYGTESNEAYFKAVIDKAEYIRLCHDALLSTYANSIYQWVKEFDIVIIDGEPIEWRDDCVKPALDCLVPGGKLIIDNWQQASVGWLPSEETQQLLSRYPVNVYPQKGHPDWKTAVFTII